MDDNDVDLNLNDYFLVFFLWRGGYYNKRNDEDNKDISFLIFGIIYVNMIIMTIISYFAHNN